jgi:hypothetical protein
VGRYDESVSAQWGDTMSSMVSWHDGIVFARAPSGAIRRVCECPVGDTMSSMFSWHYSIVFTRAPSGAIR